MGAADRSYGVQVARLAGLPETVIARARQVLETLESRARDGQGAGGLASDLPLFAAPPPPPPARASATEDLLENLHPDEMTPREALDAIYRLKSLTKSSAP